VSPDWENGIARLGKLAEPFRTFHRNRLKMEKDTLLHLWGGGGGGGSPTLFISSTPFVSQDEYFEGPKHQNSVFGMRIDGFHHFWLSFGEEHPK
jgi:hypothetical protein